MKPDHFTVFVDRWMDEAAREAARNDMKSSEDAEQRDRMEGLVYMLIYATAVVVFAWMVASWVTT